ncbi:lipopolysaccharide biosynthesis protein [Okibacterium endophyticum]
MSHTSLTSQAALSTFGMLVQGLSRFAYTILIGRFVGPEALAHTSAILSLAILVSLIWPTGAGNAAGHFLAKALASGVSPAESLRIIKRSFLYSCMVMLAIGVPVSLIWLDATPSDLLVAACLIVAWSGYILTRGIRMGLGKVTSVAMWDSISSALTIGLLILVMATGLDWALLWPITIGYALFALSGWSSLETRYAELDPDLATHRSDVWRLTGWNSLGLIASNGLIQFAMIFVYAAAPSFEAGLFAAAMSLATPASMLAQAVSQVLIPRFSAWAAAPGERRSRRPYLIVLGGMTGVLAVAFAAVAAVTPWFIPLLYGPGYEGAINIMVLLLIGVFLFSVGLIATSFLISTERTRQSSWCALAGTIIGVAVTAVTSVPLGAPIAAGIGVIVGYALASVSLIAVSLRRFPSEL